MMHWYDWVLILVLLVFVYKRAEGYGAAGGGGTYTHGGEIDSYNIAGGRPAEIFMNVSPAEWQQKDVSYAHWSKNNSCDS